MSIKVKKDNIRRIRIDEKAYEHLLEIADFYGCIRDEEPWIRGLLNKLATGEIWITDGLSDKQEPINPLTICFHITVPRYLKGAIAVISREIAKHLGNITRVETSTAIKILKGKTDDHLGILHIFVVFPDGHNLDSLINKLINLKVHEVKNFNNEEDISKNALFNQDKINSNTINEYLQENLVREINCIVGFKLIVKDKIGVLADIAFSIADSKLLIHSINEKSYKKNEGLAVIELFVYLKSSTTTKDTITISSIDINNLSEQIRKISNVEQQIRKIQSVIKISRMGVSSYH